MRERERERERERARERVCVCERERVCVSATVPRTPPSRHAPPGDPMFFSVTLGPQMKCVSISKLSGNGFD